MRLVAIALALAACGPPELSGDDMGGSGEPAELAGMVDAHNAVRHMVQTSPPLGDLVWDDSLAATARAWVAMCRDQDAPTGLIDHNPNRGQNVGENVFGSSGAATAQQAVTSWADEKANYDYSTNACNGICGHYTQIVWRSTERVGCAIGSCGALTFSSSIVCDYSPAGNVGNQKPY
jgi:pathogenesis-related protein 1